MNKKSKEQQLEDWIDLELNPNLLDHSFKFCNSCSKELSLFHFKPQNSSTCSGCLSNHSKQKRQQNPAKTTWERAKARAKRNGIEFSITQEDVEKVWTNTCPIYLIALKTNEGQPGPDSHSIDRINNSKGYVPGNIAIVSMRFNTEKRNLTPELLKRMLAYMNQSF